MTKIQKRLQAQALPQQEDKLVQQQVQVIMKDARVYLLEVTAISTQQLSGRNMRRQKVSLALDQIAEVITEQSI